MVLRRRHFACMKINWQDKAANLREIAGDLNIGLDSIVFLDDDPMEREWIEAVCPEVYVVPAGDPLEMLRFLALTRLFDTLSTSSEDKLRTKSYAVATARKRLREERADRDDFLERLDLTGETGTPTTGLLGRFAQLTQKTNQFNLTTRRYSAEQVEKISQDPNYELFYCACRDRFADEGVIGAAIVLKQDSDWIIDTLLLSCRVLGRRVEQAFLAAICSQAEKSGARRMLGDFIPTQKNAQTKNFYKENGFTLVSQDEGHSRWELRLPAKASLWPSWN
jgi:FkbH-like protein